MSYDREKWVNADNSLLLLENSIEIYFLIFDFDLHRTEMKRWICNNNFICELCTHLESLVALEDKINFYEIVKVIETLFDFDRHYSVRATIVENRLMLIIDFHQVMHGN